MAAAEAAVGVARGNPRGLAATDRASPVAVAAHSAGRHRTERRAGRYTIDLMVQGPPNLLDLVAAEAVDPIPPLLVGPETDASKWPDGKFSFSDNAGKYVLAMLGGMGGVGIYNPKAVNISELTTYKDLLNPKE